MLVFQRIYIYIYIYIYINLLKADCSIFFGEILEKIFELLEFPRFFFFKSYRDRQEQSLFNRWVRIIFAELPWQAVDSLFCVIGWPMKKKNITAIFSSFANSASQPSVSSCLLLNCPGAQSASFFLTMDNFRHRINGLSDSRAKNKGTRPKLCVFFINTSRYISSYDIYKMWQY